MKQTLQGTKKHEVVDSESVLVIELIQEMLLCERDGDIDPIEYLEKYDRFIRGLGRLLKLLGLAELDECRLIGWKAKRRLISLIAERGARPLKGTKNRASDTDRALLDLLLAAADWDAYYGRVLACKALEALGLLQHGLDGWKPMPLLAELYTEASALTIEN